MKKIRKISIVSFLAVFFVAFLMAICVILSKNNISIIAQAEMLACQESQCYDNELNNLTRLPTIDDNFKDDEIIVILDWENSGTGLKNSIYDFDKVVTEFDKVDNLDVHSIKDLFSLENDKPVADTYRRMLSVKLEIPGKDNIIEAIEQLQELDMVISAEPQYTYEVVEDWVPVD